MNWLKFFPLTPKPRDIEPAQREIVLTPRPEYRRARLAQLSPERASNAYLAIACVQSRELAERFDKVRRERVAAIKEGRV